MKNIPYLKYYLDSIKLSEQEKSIRAMLMDWLPDKIIDCHAHCNQSIHIVDISDSLYNHINSTFLDFDLERSISSISRLFPGKVVQTLRFSHPMGGIDIKSANEYLINNSPANDRVAICGIPDDIDYTNNLLGLKGIAALKMYHAFFSPPVSNIFDFFKPEILETAQFHNIPIILHLPVPISSAKNDLSLLLNDFPNLRVILAHLGVPITFDSELELAYKQFAKFDNLFMDTSMIMSADIIRSAIDLFGHERILYGTDQPLNLLKGRTHYDSNNCSFRFVTNYPYHWVNPIDFNKYRHISVDSINIHWHSLCAIRDSLQGLSMDSMSIKMAVFFKNAKMLFGF
ncbi:hypothetical protein EOM71_03230 [Candidatus Falkowbacteria bacterium]|nr:hypothetical protein [Candidatus Falkowbacteria bacterium]